MNEIVQYIRSGYPGIFIETNEIKRAIQTVVQSIKQEINNINIVSWDLIRGIPQVENGEQYKNNPLSAIEFLSSEENTVLIMENLDNFFGLQVAQTISNCVNIFKEKGNHIIGIGTNGKTIPNIIKEYFPIIDFVLPNKDEIKQILEKCISNAKEEAENNNITDYDFNDITDNIINAFLGMTHEEIENTFARTLITDKCINSETVMQSKKKIIESTGFMTFFKSVPINEVGGLEEYKDYWNKRKEPFLNSDSIKPKTKAILLSGLPGTGKSLVMKATASILNWPLIILDIGALKGGIVGETEKNVRQATKIIDGIGRAVIGLEEVEKLFGSTGKGMAHETSEGMLNYFLTWMQERESDAVVIATCNNVELLPPELTRMGRWDSIFFVDLPNKHEIQEIIKIKNKQYFANIPCTNEFAEELFLNKWSGAEIEQLVKDSHFDDYKEAMKKIPILAKHKKEQLSKIYEQATMFRKANAKTINKLAERLNTKRKLKLRSKQ